MRNLYKYSINFLKFGQNQLVMNKSTTKQPRHNPIHPLVVKLNTKKEEESKH